jgi:F-type H+-transporting ATPase subunit a
MSHHVSWFNFFPLYDSFYENLQNNFSHTIVFNCGFFPKIPVFETTHHVYAAITVFIILSFLSIRLFYKIKDVQDCNIPNTEISLLNILEIFYENLLVFMENILGKQAKQHIPFVGSLALFILFSNLIGLIPGSLPATDNLNTSLACGLSTFIYFNYQGLKKHKIHHLTHLANPSGIWWGWFLAPLFFPLEMIGLCVRPISLGVRLAGNLIGDHSVVLIFTGLMPILLPLPFLFFGLLICVIQTYVFCLLTCVYILLHTDDSH